MREMEKERREKREERREKREERRGGVGLVGGRLWCELGEDVRDNVVRF